MASYIEENFQTSLTMKNVLISVILFATAICIVQGVDRTVEQGASGSDVVLAKVESSGVFRDSDKRLLRRIAYVESRDGTTKPPNGGIWNVSRDAFENTQQNTLTDESANKPCVFHRASPVQRRQL